MYTFLEIYWIDQHSLLVHVQEVKNQAMTASIEVIYVVMFLVLDLTCVL